MARFAGYAVASLAGLALYTLIFRADERNLVYLKLAGRADQCTWSDTLRTASISSALSERVNDARSILTRGLIDATDRLERIDGGPRSFWMRSEGSQMPPLQLAGYLLADHAFLAERFPNRHVQKGDVVIDVGGHVGVFTDLALRRGASRVLTIEPDPANFECLRRNFAAEIESGQVILMQAGAWSSPGEMELTLSDENSGMGTLVAPEKQGRKVKVPVGRIDDMVAALGFDNVSFIKMDIEGAEGEALKGASEVLKRFKPRMIIDSYHKAGDEIRLPKLIREMNPAYTTECGPCEYRNGDDRLVPHVIFYF